MIMIYSRFVDDVTTLNKVLMAILVRDMLPTIHLCETPPAPHGEAQLVIIIYGRFVEDVTTLEKTLTTILVVTRFIHIPLHWPWESSNPTG